MKAKYERVVHGFPPFYDKNSRILILGSMPSRKSRELSFYYMHPQNRFWKVLSLVYDEEVPNTLDEKKQFLLDKKIALWDCVESCDIKGSLDSSIKNVIPTNLSEVINNSNIKRIYVTGKKAYDLYMKFHYEKTKMPVSLLPSTSSLNVANYSIDDLVDIYKVIRKEDY